MDMQEISYKEMKFNPFNLIGDEWMLVTAGNERLRVGERSSGMQSGCNTMTASWDTSDASGDTMTQRLLSTCVLRDIPRSSWMKSRISRSASWISRSRNRWPIWVVFQDVTRIR